MIVYSKSAGLNPAAVGKLETPIKMIIEHESDLQKKKGGACDLLFNVEKSNRFGETIVAENEFSVFKAAAEGDAAEFDGISEVGSKFIEHIQFMKEFVISAEMMEDASFGVAADAKRRAENFVRAYYKTINRICEMALSKATQSVYTYANASLDLTVPDGKPLFNSKHSYGKNENAPLGSQSNYFWGNVFSEGAAGSRVAKPEIFEEALGELAIKLRNMKDECGEPLGYTADTIILPGNRPIAESIAKKVCGSYGSVSGNGSEINIQYGNWNVVVLPGWQAEDDRMMIMSSEANKNLAGNMFFNRIPLTVSNWQDNHTGNYHWCGRCRFGVGFGSYKHILLAVDSAEAVTNAREL